MGIETIKLGLMPPMTGLVGMYGMEISRAGQIACDEINEHGGVLGKRLQLVIEDDGSLPDSAVAAAKKLVERHGCAAIIGNLLSNARIAVAYQVAEPLRIPYLNFSFYEGSIFSRYFFHFAALPNQQIDLMIPYMLRHHGPRMFFAGNNYEWPRGSIDAAKRALQLAGGEVVGEHYCPIGVDEAEIGELLDRVMASDADVFVPYFAGSDQLLLLNRFSERGMKQYMAVVMGHYDEIMSSQLLPEVRDGFYSCNSYFMPLDTLENRRYLERLALQDGVSGIWPAGNGIMTNFGEGAYLCVKAFAQAANQAGSLDADDLVAALKNISVSGPQGRVQMDPITHHAKVNTYLARCQADGTFAIVERFGAIDPELPERYRHLLIRTQSELREDVYLQSRMIEQMTDAIFLAKASDGAIIYINPGAERMFGGRAKQLKGKHFSELFSCSKTAPNIALTIGSALNQMGIWSGEAESFGDQGPIWCAVSASVFTHPEHGEVWMLMFKDTSAVRRAEQTLLATERRFEELIDSLKDRIVWEADAKTMTFSYVSPQAEQMLGYGVNEWFKPGFWMSHIHPGDQTWAPEYCMECIQRLENHEFKYRFMAKDGRIVWINDQVSVVVENGQARWLRGIMMDITEQMRYQEELSDSYNLLQTVVDSVPARVFWKDRSLHYLGCNPAFAHDAGLDQPNDLIGKDDTQLSWSKQAELYRADDRQVMDSGVPKIAYEEPQSTPDGQTIWLRTSKVPLRNTAAQIIGVLGVYEDITEQKQAAAKLEKYRLYLEELVSERTAELSIAKEAAESASQAKSSFLANMSHELRTPLNAIMGMTEMALQLAKDSKQQEQLEKAVKASKHLLAVINDILDISRIEADRLTLEKTQFQLSEVFDNLYTLLIDKVREKQLSLNFVIAPAISELNVEGDPFRIQQVLINLGSNAIKFTDSGSVTIAASVTEESDNELLLSLKITDTGIGISPQNLERLFNAFEQGDNSMTRKFGGTGLGLVISRRLARLMDGDINVESIYGEGSTFTFTVRLKKVLAVSASAQDETANADLDIELIARQLAGLRILLVEDDPFNQEVAKYVLEDMGLQIDLAEDGLEAVNMAQQTAYALILMDVQMPKMNGMDATRAIRQLPGRKDTPILAMTANAFAEDRQLCLDAGMNDHVAKPIERQLLLETLLKWLPPGAQE